MTERALLLTKEGVRAVQEGLAELDLDGWLLFDFHEQNPIAVGLLGLGHHTRRAYALVPREGEPEVLIHAIECSNWRQWPWKVRTYSGWREMEEELADFLGGLDRLAMEVSERSSVPTLDRTPAGILELIRGQGVEVVSSGDLVSAFYAVWTEPQLARHRDTADTVAAVARDAFRRAAEAIDAGETIHEGVLAAWIRSELPRRGVHEGVDCIVAVGRTASDPHYDPGEKGEEITRGDLLLIDLWGRPSTDDVFADQTWMAKLGPEVSEREREVWETVRSARDAALDFLRERHAAGEEVRGFEVDDVARSVIGDAGYGEYFVHRTGHSMDLELHGSGPNLDNLETRDDRRLLSGVAFSVEPGIYIPGEIGVRSEVNVYMGADGPEVTPPSHQDEIFLLLDG